MEFGLDRTPVQKTVSISAVPITDPAGNVVAVIEAINKIDPETSADAAFAEFDRYVLQCLAVFLGEVRYYIVEPKAPPSVSYICTLMLALQASASTNNAGFALFNLIYMQSMHRLGLYEDATRSSAVNAALVRATKRLAQEVEVSRVVETLVRALRRLTRATRVNVFLVD